MKRFFTKKSVALVLFSILLFGFFYFNNTAQALTQAEQAAQNRAAAPAVRASRGGGVPQAAAPAANVTSAPAVGASRAGSVPPAPTVNSATTVTASRYSLFHPIDSLANLATDTLFTLYEKVLDLIFVIVSLVMAAAAGIFDLAIHFSLFNLSSLFTSSAVVINQLWALIRDTVNLFFIFILLYIAISMIVGRLGLKSKATLINVVVSAIFVNFSMFIAKLLIDFGNIIATALYNQIAVTGTISGTIMDNLGLKELVSVSHFSASITNHYNFIMAVAINIVIVSVMTYVYFYAAFVFIGRAAMLILLVITSPIGFVGNTIPGLASEAKDWWKKLIDQILVAPIFLLFLLIITKIMSGGALKNSIDVAGKAGEINVAGFFYFIIIMKFIMVALAQTKKLSGEVGEIAMKVAGGAVLAGAAIATGGASLAAGAVSAESVAAGAAAKAAGGSALRARLAFSGKQAVSGVGKFASGGYEKEPGYFAKALTLGRNQASAGFKTATGGAVDLIGFQKSLEKSAKENEANILNKAAKIGPTEEDKVKLKELKGKDEEITKKAGQKVASEGAELQKQHESNQEKVDKAQSPEELKSAQANVQASETAITEFKKTEKERLKAVKEEIAKAEGVSLEELAKLTAKEVARDAYASEIEKAGFFSGLAKGLFITQLGEKSRKNLASNIRKGKKGEKSFKEEMEGLTKKYKEEAGETETKKEEKPKEEKPAESKPKEEGGGEEKK